MLGWVRSRADCFPELIELSLRKVPEGSFRESVQLQRSQPDPGEPDDVVSDALHHPPDDPVATFVNDHPEYSAFVLVSDRPQLVRLDPLSIDHHAAGKVIQNGARRVPIEQNFVLFLEFIARMGDPVGQFTVVGQQKQTSRRTIESSDRNDSLRHIDQIQHRSPAALISRCRNVSLWLVEQDVPLALVTHRSTIDRNRLILGIDPEPERTDDLAVDRHPAIGNHLLGFSSRRNSARRQHLVQALHNSVVPSRVQAERRRQFWLSNVRNSGTR